MLYCIIIMPGNNYKQCFILGGEKHLLILDICVSLKKFAYKDKWLQSLWDVLTLVAEILEVLFDIENCSSSFVGILERKSTSEF